MKLNEIKDNPAAMKPANALVVELALVLAKQVRRGVKKGQKSRSGVAIKGYEGGQMPIYMRLPKRGFNAPFSKDYNIVSVGRVQTAIDAGKLDCK